MVRRGVESGRENGEMLDAIKTCEEAAGSYDLATLSAYHRWLSQNTTPAPVVVVVVEPDGGHPRDLE